MDPFKYNYHANTPAFCPAILCVHHQHKNEKGTDIRVYIGSYMLMYLCRYRQISKFTYVFIFFSRYEL